MTKGKYGGRKGHEPKRRSDIGGRLDIRRMTKGKGPFEIEEEGPRTGWMRSEEPDDHDRR